MIPFIFGAHRSDFAHLRSKRSRINSWRIYARGYNIPLFIRPCDGLDQPNQNPGRLEIKKNKRGVERWEELLGSKHITHQYYLEPGAGAKAEGESISAVPICHHQWQDRITRNICFRLFFFFFLHLILFASLNWAGTIEISSVIFFSGQQQQQQQPAPFFFTDGSMDGIPKFFPSSIQGCVCNTTTPDE